MTAASRSLATAPWGARFASGLLLCYTTSRDTTIRGGAGRDRKRDDTRSPIMVVAPSTRPRVPAPDPGLHAQSRDKGGANRESRDSRDRVPWRGVAH